MSYIKEIFLEAQAWMSEYPKQGFIAGQQISTGDLKNRDDLKLIYLLWVYDIYFPWTLQKVWERGFLQKIIATLPEDPDMVAPLERILNVVRGKVKN